MKDVENKYNCDVLMLSGATASGKTSVAIELAKRLNGEVISADSMQIYKYFDIGTAKPTKEEMGDVVHHMIDFVEPDCTYDVSEYKSSVENLIGDIQERGKFPIICGGTGLYFDALMKNIEFSSVEVDFEYREELEKIAGEHGNQHLHDMLREIDPVSADNIHPNNVKRVIRAIEATKTSGVPFSEQKKNAVVKPPAFSYKLFFLEHDREVLYERINRRVDIMLEMGLVDEVREMYAKGYLGNTTAAQAIGYKELLKFVNREINFEDSVELLKRESRRYAKRQITWFKQYSDRINIPCGNKSVEEIAQNIISQIIEIT